MADQYFHFTLGPVQAFVAQARRTRDFWSGSFLLSWLASVAMQEVKAQGGDIQFPLPDDNYLKYLTGDLTEPDNAPEQGSIPNRFKAMQAKVPTEFDPHRVTNAVEKAWAALAEQIWQGDFENLSVCGAATREVWQRQVSGFWDISWVLSHNAEESNLLDRRKNWRSYMAPEEPGVSCMMMDGWQELSGQPRPGKKLGQFWRELRKSGGRGVKTDLREQEYLCAIGWIKRRFAHCFSELSSVDMGDWQLYGWELPINVPSVNYLAAAPWLAKSIQQSASDQYLHMKLRNLEASISAMKSSQEGRSISLKRVVEAASATNLNNWQWQQVNGRYLYQDEVSLLAERGDDAEEEQNPATALLRQLQDVQGGQYALGQPSDFYSILLMDGDSLGSQMSDANKQEAISQALNNFTRQVPDVVKAHSGFLVYAGGDDVLALLSVDDALACADALRKLYNDCFEQQNKALTQSPTTSSVHITSSLSGALMYCHYKSPLASNLAKAHPLLDNMAKDECGRDSLAIQVWKPGGLHCSWSSPWDVQQGSVNRVSEINQLVSTLIYERQNDDQIARKFFFKLDQLIQTLGLDKSAKKPGIAAEHIKSLFQAAWLHTGNKVKDLPAGLADQLLDISRTWQRYHNTKTNEFEVTDRNRFSADALKLIHFLAEELQQSPQGYTPAQQEQTNSEQHKELV